MPKKQQTTFICSKCDYQVTNKAKYDRHMKTLKHDIAVNGVICCNLKYFDKHKWVNHKKSPKHMTHINADEMVSADESTSVEKKKIFYGTQ